MAIVLKHDLFVAIPRVPFCDKNFKLIRVVADSLSRLCLSVFYQIMSVCYRPFNAKTSHTYQSLAHYQNLRGGNQLFAYCFFRKEIIDFSVNRRFKESLSEGETEVAKLKEIYGEEVIDSWSKIRYHEFSVQGESLSRLNGGCCFGISLDFISQYLQKTGLEMDSLEAVKSISGRYVEGAPDGAQLCQILYRALHSNHQRLASDPDYKKAVENCCNLAKQLTSNRFGLRESEQRYTIDGLKKNSKESRATFKTFVKDLPEGSYTVCGGGHAMVFIKTNTGPHFIQDSNLGILAVDPTKSDARLWEIAGDYLEKNRNGKFIFSPYKLRDA